MGDVMEVASDGSTAPPPPQPQVKKSISELPPNLSAIISEVDQWPAVRRDTALTQLLQIYVHDVAPAEQVELQHRACADDDVSKLVKYGVPHHLWIVDTHRRSISAVHEMVMLAVPHETAHIGQQVREHDLSKYAACEVFGYTHRWVHHVDSDLWRRACDHHITTNAHHPQAFPQGEDMTGEGLLESVVDMLGCRYERNLKTRHISITELFLIEEHFLTRFTPPDRERVRRCYREWGGKLLALRRANPQAFLTWENKYGRPVRE